MNKYEKLLYKKASFYLNMEKQMAPKVTQAAIGGGIKRGAAELTSVTPTSPAMPTPAVATPASSGGMFGLGRMKVAAFLQKQAATADELTKPVKIKSTQPKMSYGDTVHARMFGGKDDNFVHGANIKTRLKPSFDDKANDVKYETEAEGRSLLSDSITANRYYNDIPYFYKGDESDEAYAERRKRNVQYSKNAGKGLKYLGHTLNVAAPLAALSLAHKLGGSASEKVTGVLAGLLLGSGANLGLHGLAKGSRNKKYLSSLKPEERTKLKEYLNRDAEELSQDAHAADRLTSHTTHVYMV